MKEHKLAAIVFTDIVGYTKRMEADEEDTMKLLARQREIIFPLVKDFGGEIIKEIGDGLLIMFNSANQAVRFTMTVQEKLQDEDLTIRAGIHIGDVIFKEGDVFGSAVNIAARIEPLAPSGGICISEDVRSQIRNQSDIITTSIGRKELKGVNATIEIFRIDSREVLESQSRVPFFKDLWQKRVIQIASLYLVFSFLIRLLMGYFVNEYMLSPHLTNLVWYILLSLIPSIILISYFHGKKGVSKWTRVELIGLPVNVIAAVLVLVIVFQGKNLGAMTTRLTVENEDGVSIEKIVAKNEFRKKIFIFNFDNISDDISLDYLQYGIPFLIQQDLSQDILITPFIAMDIYSRIAETGYEDAIDLPLTLMQRFAVQRHMNYFISGTINYINDEYHADVKIYETRNTKLISELSIVDKSPFALADKMSIELKKSMGLPESHISETIDLPVKEITTGSDQALAYFSMATLENARNNGEEYVRLLDLAIQEDQGFGLAYMAITIAYFQLGNQQKVQESLSMAMNLLHKLPERQKFILKYVKYILEQKPEKALSIIKMWAELYPDDILPHQTLAQRYAMKNMIPEAIKENKKILELDPEQYQNLIVLGQLYLILGDFDSALICYERYARELPQEPQSYRNLGNYYEQLGDRELAKQNYEKALLLSDGSEKLRLKINLANVLLNSGDFVKAYDQYEDALSISRTARDSAMVYEALINYYIIKGQAKKSLESFKLQMRKAERYLNPKDYMASQAINLEPYVHAGEFEEAVEILENIADQLEPPLDKLVPFGYMLIYTANGDMEKARESIPGAEDLIKGFGQEALMANVYFTEGRISEQVGEYNEAIDHFTKFKNMNPSLYTVHINLARCYRLLKDYKNAEKELDAGLKFRPFDPEMNYEAALMYFDKGDEKEGMEYLERAVEIWKDADSDYEKANTAKEKLNSINS